MNVLMTLILVLVLAGCAAGQGNAGRTLAEDATTANGTEETTIQQEAGGRMRPPDSTLSYGEQEVGGTLGSYCWSLRSSSLVPTHSSWCHRARRR
jgi:hypothetical protein